MSNSRRTASFIIARWIATGDFPSSMLPSGIDRGFVQDLVYTVARRLRTLRKVLGAQVRTWPRGELEALLYVGAAQILYMDDVPDFAAVNETVEAAKECGNPSVARVVNGVLRNLIRKRAEIASAMAGYSLADRESYPGEIVRRWCARFGEDGAERLCRWHNSPADTYLAYPDRFEKLERARRVDQVDGYAEGRFIVQDPGTAYAIELLDPKRGERILDACAAPGGKCVQIAWRGANVTACEVNPRRRRRLMETLSRMGLGDVAVVSDMDGAGSFDKVLVDAPCSNTGVFRRRPDARWNWNRNRLAELVRIQGEILDRTARLVEEGGVLVYSTCSNEPEENMDQVRAFLGRHPEFEFESAKESVPFETGFDGAFAARLIFKGKKETADVRCIV